MLPQISLVMPALNAERFIAAALDSAPRGTAGLRMELILADGGSNDTTLEIAAAYPFVRVLAGPDRGLYDGINRAIAEARGGYIALLNSDDVLHDGGLAKMFEAAERNAGADMVTGGVSYGADLDDFEVSYPQSRLSIEGLAFGIPAINARLFKASALREIGPFRTDLGVGADREFLARAHISGIRGIHIRAPAYHYRTHAGSLTLAGDGAARQRIWRSDIEVMHAILRMPGLSKQQVRAAARGLAVLRAKQSASRLRAGGANEEKQVAGLSLGDYKRLPTALQRWWHWRGRLAGY